jgi:hypothetical protein
MNDSLGEDFEKKEDELFADDGFAKIVDKVAGIQKRFGSYDLAQFMPKVYGDDPAFFGARKR